MKYGLLSASAAGLVTAVLTLAAGSPPAAAQGCMTSGYPARTICPEAGTLEGNPAAATSATNRCVIGGGGAQSPLIARECGGEGSEPSAEPQQNAGGSSSGGGAPGPAGAAGPVGGVALP